MVGVKWKYVEANAAAYYYHGLILDEGNTEKFHGMAVAALQAADEYFKESKKACEAFNAAPPSSRNPPLWGTMKYLSEKIPKDASSKVRIKCDLYSHEKIMETAPTLPNFALALKPRKKISVISEISVVRKHGNIDGNIGIISISIKITWKPRKL
ncbi:hypothetical protein ACFXTO_047073 [Malus domestica]